MWPEHSSYPWSNTGATADTTTPVWIGEFGTCNTTSDILSTVAGSEGQWFTDLVNFINSSFTPTTSNNSGYSVQTLHWTYWAINGEDSYGLLNSGYNGLALPAKEYSLLCFDQQGPFAVVHGTGSGRCGSTGAFPNPE